MSDSNGNVESSGKKITIKIDAPMVMAILSLLGVAGVGTYNHVESSDTQDTLKTGVELQVNEAYSESFKRVAKLSRIVKRQEAQIADLYEIIDWLLPAMNDIGSKKHKALWERLKREAPESADFGEDANGYGGYGGGMVTTESAHSAPMPPEEMEDDLFDEVEEPPKRLQFPAMDAIEAAIQQRKQEGT